MAARRVVHVLARDFERRFDAEYHSGGLSFGAPVIKPTQRVQAGH